ncbi:hypothetical protein EUX98_g8673 [Antrodiella citrinella]|uniref:RlpA-like protein double-psi beta-barrel domain-containing protein n=1 Tax=Antrodiella citrinella TaxID=2447956 RepID=A0A4S4M5S0_9APHY|nr:hypothetical protein EUX98_g8673 [Antrodiella citrinella]
MRVAWTSPLIAAVLAVLFASPSTQAADAHNHRQLGHGRRHALNRINAIEKRAQFEGATFTNFVDGMGACGNFNSGSDFIIALSVPMYANGAHCGEAVTLTYNGKTVQATVADECQACDYTAIDLSDGLFAALVPGGLSVGEYVLEQLDHTESHVLEDAVEHPFVDSFVDSFQHLERDAYAHADPHVYPRYLW